MPSDKTLRQWLQWLAARHPEQTIDLGLARLQTVAEQLAVLQPAPYVITVAGTNGKGSTVALLESLLLAADYRVGVYTSPHLIHFNERIRLNGQPVDDDALCAAFATVSQCRGATELTYFEFTTLVALHCFNTKPLDYGLLEVGLGGRLDATNIVTPDVAVITTVALDHQAWLGDTVEAIAREKAGILRANKPAVYGDLSPPRAIIEQAERCSAPLYCRGIDFDSLPANAADPHWTWYGRSARGDRLENRGLPGTRLGVDNAATALQVLQLLPDAIPKPAIVAGLTHAYLPGRLQALSWPNAAGEPIDLLLDVAHNAQAAARLATYLHQQTVPGKTRIVLAMCQDKDWAAVIAALCRCIDDWFVTQFLSPRALAAQVLSAQLQQQGIQAVTAPDVLTAVQQALAISVSGDRLVVTGSFMTVAAILRTCSESYKSVQDKAKSDEKTEFISNK